MHQTKPTRTTQVLLGIDARDADESTPLMAACVSDNVAAVRVLLRCGADARVARADGDTALHIAARLNAAGCAAVLLAHDASPIACNRAGETPVDIAKSTNPDVF
jgi:ankyrin repeat protein